MKANKGCIAALVAVLIVAFLDQLSKFLITQNLKSGDSIPIVKNLLHITHTTNIGSLFGLFKNIRYANPFFIILSIMVIAVLICWIVKLCHKNEKKVIKYIAVGVLAGGAAGNLIDRILLGHVVDFIDFRFWHVFNIADSAITIGVILSVFYLWKE